MKQKTKANSDATNAPHLDVPNLGPGADPTDVNIGS